MKKIIRILTICLLLAMLLPAAPVRAQLFDQGDIVVSAGLGLGSNYYSFGTGYSNIMPVIYASGDYCLREDLGPGNLGVGAIMAFSSYKETWPSTDYYWKVTTFMFGARGTYHFTDLVDKLDLYGGITMGAELAFTKTSDSELDDYSSSAGNGFLAEFFGGARYYFTDNFSVNGELGYGISWLKLGVSLKF
jgi:hypothetical protein